MSTMAANNLPEQPYKKFFGRKDSVKEIKKQLLDGGTFIASIDGVGGIGKTALAYHFCQENILGGGRFDYLVWISSKTTFFDPFSAQATLIDPNFQGINTLFDSLLSVVGFEELIERDLDYKKGECGDILQEEPVFLVLDNLENVEDEEFFLYIMNEINQFAGYNRNLKVLTTSRKRRKIGDFPINIEGLEIEDALSMLKYKAEHHDAADILRTDANRNMILVERVQRIPLGIEFIVGQLASGKTRGDIHRQLDGYPELEDDAGDEKNQEKLSQIIQFLFRDMYEDLDPAHQEIFVTVAILESNKHKSDPSVSLDALMNITSKSKRELENILDDLKENNLLDGGGGNTYRISPMAISFAKNHYDEYSKNEDDVVGKWRDLVDTTRDETAATGAGLFLRTARKYWDENDSYKAKNTLMDGLEIYEEDYRLHYELGKIQWTLHEYRHARDSFQKATDLSPSNVRVWSDWITMEDSTENYNIAIRTADLALTKTRQNVSILIQKLKILRFMNSRKSPNALDTLRETAKREMVSYLRDGRSPDVLSLLDAWEKIEYEFAKLGDFKEYIFIIYKLFEVEENKEKLVNTLSKATRVLRENGCEKFKDFEKKATLLKDDMINTVSTRYTNQLFQNKDYDAAKKEANKILALLAGQTNRQEDRKSALRILLHCYNQKGEYKSIIDQFKNHKGDEFEDQTCNDLYQKAKKEIEGEERDETINMIVENLRNGEVEVRKLVMWSLENNDACLPDILKRRNIEGLITKWENRRVDAGTRKGSLIDYSTLSELRDVFLCCRKEIMNKVENKHRSIHKRIVPLLNLILPERNEVAHARLHLYESEELEYILKDTERLIKLTSELKVYTEQN